MVSWSLSLGVVTLLVGATLRQSQGATAYPGAAVVRDALSWAATGSPAPYPMRDAGGRTVGVVYTPYVRLAISAQLARKGGGQFQAEQVTPADVDPLFGGATRGWWYIALRLDVTSYTPARHDFDVVLLSGAEARIGERDARLATPSGLPLWVGRGRGMAYPPLMIGMTDDDAVYVLAGVDPARLQDRLPVRAIAVDRNRSGNQVIAEAVVTREDVARWR